MTVDGRGGRVGGALSWGYPFVVWCLAFAALHVFWALGGTFGLATSAGAELAAERPLWFVLMGLWGVATLLVVGATFGAVLAGWRPTPRSRLRRLAVGLGWLVGGVLLVRGLLVEIALLADLGGVTAEVGPQQTRWSEIVWNPWFVIGGVLLMLATRQFQRRTA